MHVSQCSLILLQAQVSLHDVLATLFTEQHASQLRDSWFMQGVTAVAVAYGVCEA